VVNEVGRLLTRHHGGLDWPALLGSLRNLAAQRGQEAKADSVRPLAALFVEVFALSSKISLVLDDDGVTDRVAGIFARHVDPVATAEGATEQNMDGLVQDFAEVVELASVTTLPTLYATVRRCVQATSDFFVGLRRLEEQKGSEPDQGAHELLTRVLHYLASKSDQSKVGHSLPRSVH
jgi:hypothetical protein